MLGHYLFAMPVYYLFLLPLFFLLLVPIYAANVLVTTPLALLIQVLRGLRLSDGSLPARELPPSSLDGAEAVVTVVVVCATTVLFLTPLFCAFVS